MTRVAVFIDGFNLYHSVKQLRNPRLKWLDLTTLSKRFVKPDESLVGVKYFTALATWEEEKRLRHKRYIRALELTGVQVIYGRFKRKGQTCTQCGARYRIHEEKRTDVNIAVALLSGAMRDEYDTALLVSGDTDLIPAVQALKQLHPDKRVGVLFPYRRHTAEMEQSADFSDSISAAVIESCRLPEKIRLPSGKDLTPPDEWC